MNEKKKVANELFNEWQQLINVLLKSNPIVSIDEIIEKFGHTYDSVVIRILELLDWEDDDEGENFAYVSKYLTLEYDFFSMVENKEDLDFDMKFYDKE